MQISAMQGNFLDVYIARHKLTPGETLAQTREHYVRDKPGSRALAWSCSLSDAQRKALWGDVSFTGPITHCLVAEGATMSLWDWLQLGRSIGPKHPFGEGASRWKQQVMRAIVEAQVSWSESTDYWGDAIKSLLESNRMRLSIARPAVLFLFRMIMATPKSAVDPGLYNQLASLLDGVYPKNKEYHRARFDLRHPVRPSTASFMELLKSGVNSNQDVKRWMNPKTPSAGAMLFFTLINLAQSCLAEGNRANAEWVLDLGYDRVPQLFSGKAQYLMFMSEVEDTIVPPSAPRKATKFEIAAGKEVDADGNLITSPAAQTFYQQIHVCRNRSGR